MTPEQALQRAQRTIDDVGASLTREQWISRCEQLADYCHTAALRPREELDASHD